MQYLQYLVVFSFVNTLKLAQIIVATNITVFHGLMLAVCVENENLL